MFKSIFVLALAASVSAAPSPLPSLELHELAAAPGEFVITPVTDVGSPEVDLCQPCIQFAGQALNQLINLILNKAVTGSCNKLCGALANATHSKQIGSICEILCEVEGIQAFIKWIQNADLSPIYDCEKLGVCKTNDNGDAKLTSWLASPASGPQRTQFTLAFTYSTKNGTSTGEIEISLKTIDHQQIGFNSIYVPYSTTAGSFKGSGTIDTTPADPSCDPTQKTCEMWLPGTYNASIRICEGECGSKHPHSGLYDSGTTSFQITNGPAPPGPSPPGPPPPPGPPGKHYEDPNAGPCSADEQAIQITGLSGSFCSPSCSTTSPCPTDVPDGASAKPTCALSKQGSPSPTNCALICNPSATGDAARDQCPDKASCKKIQTVGICTYDN